jgi:hypothetical protein
MSGSETEAAAGGWQPDPTGRHQLRYWSGSAWTDDVSNGGVTSRDPLTGGPPAAVAFSPVAQPGARGPIGKPSSAGTTIVLTIVTLGIWGFVWVYRQHRDMKAYNGQGVGGGLGLVIAIFGGFVTSFLVSNIITPFVLASEVQQLYERDGQKSPIQTSAGAWSLIPFGIGTLIFYLKVQPAINDFWVARGATPA